MGILVLERVEKAKTSDQPNILDWIHKKPIHFCSVRN